MAHVQVWRHPESQVVVGYYAILPAHVAPEGLSRKVRGGYSGPIPGYLIAKMAIARELQGQGHGASLLLDALESVAATANLGGGRLVVVDAIDDNAFTFYKHCGFTPIGESLRLFARIDAIDESLASAQYGKRPENTKAAGAHFSWAVSVPPEPFIVIQMEPIAHTSPGSSEPKDVVAHIFDTLGFQSVGAEAHPLAPASVDIHCRVDSPQHATIVVRMGTNAVFDIPIPHDRPALTASFLEAGVAKIYTTTDSIGDDGAADRKKMARDMANGTVRAATVAVRQS